MRCGFVAVLTGDVARSTELDSSIRAGLPATLEAIAASAGADFPEAVRRPIDVFRGDSWQLLVEDPALALRVAVYVRSHIRAAHEGIPLDTRIAIGLGAVDFVPETNISGGDGEAFRLSGRALDAMGRSFRMAVAASDRLAPHLGEMLDAIARLVDAQATAWTQRQAFAVSRALLGMTQDEIGAEWRDRPISQQSVAQHLASAGWNPIAYALSAAETALKDHRVYNL